MATNGDNNMEDTDMAECDGEKVVTMMDVLQEEQDFEDDANAVLGASDEKNCTYSKGYIKRQAIYACLTCCSEAKDDPTKRAGVCLACSLNCHENHELVELYTKRNFRCDCGNPKFNSHPCQFTPNKNELNEENVYNQNFSGLYCTCHRPYPDPESTMEDDEMIQCIVCEDWLHSLHLEASVPGVDQYSEMICKACMEKNEFLHDYSHLTVNIEIQDIDVLGINGTDTKLSNGILNTENSTDKPSDDMDVDKAQEDKSSVKNDEIIENSTSEVLLEEINKDKKADYIMQVENTEKPSLNSSDVDAEIKTHLNTDSTTIEEPSKSSKNESTIVTESKSEEKDCVNSEVTPKVISEEEAVEDNVSSEVSTKATSGEEALEDNISSEVTTKETSEKEAISVTPEEAHGVNEPQESLEAPPENTEDSKESHDNGGIEENDKSEHNVESEKVEESIESEKMEQSVESEKQAENVESEKPEDIVESQKTEQNISENKDDIEKTSEDHKEELKDDYKDSDQKPEEITPTTNGDNESPMMESEIKSDSDVNDSPNEENTELPTDVTNRADNMEDDVSTELNSKPEASKESNETEFAETNNEDCKDEINAQESKEMKRKLSIEEDAVSDNHLVKKPKLNEDACIRPKGVKRVHKGATFWPSNFRQKLCTCSECLSMYKDLSVLFLIDPEDTVFAYETLGKERVDGRATQYEKGLEALSSLDRIQQINALTEYNKMKDKLLDFLKSFKDRKEVVKEEDIKAFFAGMKPKREPDGVYFCR